MWVLGLMLGGAVGSGNFAMLLESTMRMGAIIWEELGVRECLWELFGVGITVTCHSRHLLLGTNMDSYLLPSPQFVNMINSDFIINN
jgi:hypothetical protein